jgi:hypothetical protein
VADWLDDRITRLIRALRVLDHAYALFDRARSALVLAFASDAVLDRYNDLAFAVDSSYRPGASDYYPELFPWEARAIERYFPRPPARILIGGVGGGREAFALARRGYQVVAFEPCEALRAAMITSLELPVELYGARYDDLPLLPPVTPGAPAANLEQLGRFDAAIMGWGSFAHLRSRDARVHALRALAQVTDGPLLVSFLLDSSDTAATPSRLVRLARRLLKRPDPEPGDDFAMNCGFYHLITRDELIALACHAGLAIAYFDAGQEPGYPHAVLCDGALYQVAS